MTNSTKFYLMKKCLQCFMINEIHLSKCGQCGYLFIGEATREEKEEAYNKQIKLQEKAQEE